MLRVVIDTNVFVAGFWGQNESSYPAQIITAWRSGVFLLVMSPQILREIVAKLLEKGVDEMEIEEFVVRVGEIALHIPGVIETNKLDKIDPDDNKFLAAAYESKADYLVSYDKKSLLPLKHFHGTQILSPHLFLRVILTGP
ncbi:MAG: putative toxin-antitoxin system toxin component, PIN family [Candidatus Melainabacteria bacterium]|nr:putative toxin-antitoxin system toxin component, PIN family [Candidatus Melainabacteria bacterium]